MKLSLCMIVRDEAVELAGFLPQTGTDFHQKVAVDTGSRDASAALLAEHGFEVLDFPWCNDFAAARNHGIERARGDWILVLDADERLSPEAIAQLRRAAEQAPAGVLGLLLDVRNYTDDSRDLAWRPVPAGEHAARGRRGYYATQVVRCFRNDARIRYRGAIHELVEPAIEAAGGRWSPAGVIIHHRLEERTDAAGRSKGERYLALLERKVVAEPDSAKAHWELGQQQLACGRAGAALAPLERAWQLAPGNLQIGAGYARALNGAARPLDALAVLDAIVPGEAGDARVDFERGLACVALRREENARRAFARAHERVPHAPQPLYWLARLALTKDSARAAEWLDRLAALPVDYWPERLLRIEQHLEAGRDSAAARALAEAVHGAPCRSAAEQEESATALAEPLAMLARSDRARMERVVTSACALGADSGIVAAVCYRLAQDAVARRDLGAAACTLAHVLALEPAHGRALVDLAGLHGNSGRLDLARSLLERALIASPGDPLVHRNLALAALVARPPDRGRAACHAARAEALGHPRDEALWRRIEADPAAE